MKWSWYGSVLFTWQILVTSEVDSPASPRACSTALRMVDRTTSTNAGMVPRNPRTYRSTTSWWFIGRPAGVRGGEMRPPVPSMAPRSAAGGGAGQRLAHRAPREVRRRRAVGHPDRVRTGGGVQLRGEPAAVEPDLHAHRRWQVHAGAGDEDVVAGHGTPSWSWDPASRRSGAT